MIVIFKFTASYYDTIRMNEIARSADMGESGGYRRRCRGEMLRLSANRKALVY